MSSTAAPSFLPRRYGSVSPGDEEPRRAAAHLSKLCNGPKKTCTAEDGCGHPQPQVPAGRVSAALDIRGHAGGERVTKTVRYDGEGVHHLQAHVGRPRLGRWGLPEIFAPRVAHPHYAPRPAAASQTAVDEGRYVE